MKVLIIEVQWKLQQCLSLVHFALLMHKSTFNWHPCLTNIDVAIFTPRAFVFYNSSLLHVASLFLQFVQNQSDPFKRVISPVKAVILYHTSPD